MAKANTTCTHDDCTDNVRCRNLCSRHYRQYLYRRSHNPRPKYISCGLCGVKAQIGKTGPVPNTCLGCRRSKPKRFFCRTCGGPLPHGSHAGVLHCSHACRLYWSRYKSPRPKLRNCCDCGDRMDLTLRDKSGALIYRRNAKRCLLCQAKTRPHRYGMTATQVGDRDGWHCRWCGEAVDPALVGTRSKWAPSVDHIIPWSLGGTNDPSNLQLMHRVCNSRKGVETTISS